MDSLTTHEVDDLCRTPKSAWTRFCEIEIKQQRNVLEGLVERAREVDSALSQAGLAAQTLGTKERELAQAKTALSETWTKYGQIGGERAAMIQELEYLRRELRISQTSYAQANRACTELQTRLNAAQLAPYLPEAQRETNELKATIEKLRVELLDARSTTASAQVQTNSLKRELDEARHALKAKVLEVDEIHVLDDALTKLSNSERTVKARDIQISDLKAELKELRDVDAENERQVRESRFWQLVIERQMHPRDADKVLRDAKEVLKGLHKA